VRALVLLVGAVVLVDTMFYAAITPLLPSLADELALGKGSAGVLEAAYAAGTFAGALPGGWVAARFGVRAAVLAGLGLMSVSGLVFAFGTTEWLLDAARFVQGLGGACSWAGGLAWVASAAPRERRGELLGTALGAAIVGGQLGPVLGAVAHAVGRDVVFSAAALFGAALAAWAWRTPPPAVQQAGVLHPARAARERSIGAGMALTALPSAAFGAIGVLGPLRLDDLGAGAFAIGATFFVAAGLEAAINPAVGRQVDRRGAWTITVPGLALAGVLLLVLPLPDAAAGFAALLVATTGALGVLWVPGMALITAGADRSGLDQGYAAALFSLAWAAGFTAGSAGGGAVAQATGDAVPYGAVALACLAGAGAILRVRRRRPLRSPA
jgi:predicted MFS family arabinose efflux permease